MIQTRNTSSTALRLGVAMMVGTGSVLGMSGAAQAQTVHHRSIFHRHPNATSAVAGYGAYRYAKSRRHGFMHRHPYLTGIAAAGVTHHFLKRHHNR